MRGLFRLACQSSGVLILAVLTALVLYHSVERQPSLHECRLAGRQAARRGMPVLACPHADPTRRQAWLCGWSEARVED